MIKMKFADKIKIQISIILNIPKRISINEWNYGLRLFYLNSMLIWSESKNALKHYYLRKHSYDRLLVKKIATTCDVDRNTYTQPNRQKYSNEKTRVWVLWWQGERQMPEIISTTIESIKNSTSHEVVLITLDNVKQWIDIPTYMWQKYSSGKMGAAHFSDYARVTLLAKYGGLWIDSTVLCVSPLQESIFRANLFTIRAVHATSNILDEKYVAKGRWNTQVLGTCTSGHPLFCKLKLLIETYWQKYDYMIDYLLFDDLILYIYENDEQVRRDIDALPVSNLQMHAMLPLLNNVYDNMVWDRLTTETSLFKLTYKGNYVKTMNGRDTLYGHILKLYPLK